MKAYIEGQDLTNSIAAGTGTAYFVQSNKYVYGKSGGDHSLLREIPRTKVILSHLSKASAGSVLECNKVINLPGCSFVGKGGDILFKTPNRLGVCWSNRIEENDPI